jgi:hypothetical protein
VREDVAADQPTKTTNMQLLTTSLFLALLCYVAVCGAQSGNFATQMQGLSGLLGGLKLQLHGHYCGLNHGDATYKTEPLDALDKLCMAHDQCYDGHYLDCWCDHKFIVDLGKFLKKSEVDKKLKDTARLMKGWFESSSCSCLDEAGKRKDLSGAIFAAAKGKCKRK